MSYLKHNHSLLSFNTEEAELTNILPPMDIWHLMNSNLQSDLVRDLVGQVKVNYNPDERNSEKKIGSYFDAVTKTRKYAVSENYKPHQMLYTDVRDGQRYIEGYHRPNIQIDGAFQTEMDLFLHEIQRYFNTLYPETDRALALYTPEEINDSYNEICHMLGFQVDAATIDQIVDYISDIPVEEEPYEALYQKYKMFTSFGQSRQNLGSLRAIRSFVGRLGFRTNLFEVAYLPENEGTKYQKYAIQSLVALKPSNENRKRAVASIPYASSFLISLTPENFIESVKRSALACTTISNKEDLSVLKVLSDNYSLQISQHLQTYTSLRDLFPNNVFAKPIEGLSASIIESLFDSEGNTIQESITSDNNNVYVIADDFVNKSTYNYFVLKVEGDDIRSITDDEVTTIANKSIPTFNNAYNIKNPDYSIIVEKFKAPSYSQIYKEFLAKYIVRSAEQCLANFSAALGKPESEKAYFEYGEIRNCTDDICKDRVVGFYLRSLGTGEILFTNLDLVDVNGISPILQKGDHAIIFNDERVEIDTHVITAKMFTTLLFAAILRDHPKYYEESDELARAINSIKSEFGMLSSEIYDATGLFGKPILNALKLIADTRNFKYCGEYNNFIIREIFEYKKNSLDALSMVANELFANHQKAELVDLFRYGPDAAEGYDAETFMNEVFDLLLSSISIYTSNDYRLLISLRDRIIEKDDEGRYVNSPDDMDFAIMITSQLGVLSKSCITDDHVFKVINLENAYEEIYADRFTPLYTYIATYANISQPIASSVEAFSKLIEDLYDPAQHPEVIENGYYLELPEEVLNNLEEPNIDGVFGSQTNKSNLASVIGLGMDYEENDDTSGNMDDESFNTVYIDLKNGDVFANSYDDACLIKENDTLKIILSNEPSIMYVTSSPLEKDGYAINVDWPTKPNFINGESFSHIRGVVYHKAEKRENQVEVNNKIYNYFSEIDLPEELSEKFSLKRKEIKQTKLDSIPIIRMRDINGSLMSPADLENFTTEAIDANAGIIKTSELDVTDTTSIISSGNLLLLEMDKTFNKDGDKYLITQHIIDLIKENINLNFDTIFSRPLDVGVSIDFINEVNNDGAFIYDENANIAAFLLNNNPAVLPNKIETYDMISPDLEDMVDEAIETSNDETLYVNSKYIGNSLTLWESALWNNAEILDENKYIRSIWSSIFDYVKRQTHTTLDEKFFEKALPKGHKTYEGNISKFAYGNTSFFDAGNKASFIIKNQKYDNNYRIQRRLALTDVPFRGVDPEVIFEKLGVTVNSNESNIDVSKYKDYTDTLYDFIIKHRLTDEEKNDESLAALNGFQTLSYSENLNELFKCEELTTNHTYNFSKPEDKTFDDEFSIAMNSVLLANMKRTVGNNEEIEPCMPLNTALNALVCSYNKVYKNAERAIDPFSRGDLGWLLRSAALLSQRITYTDKYNFSEIDTNTAIGMLLYDDAGYPQLYFAQPTDSTGLNWVFYEYVGSVMDLVTLDNDRNLRWFGLATSNDIIGHPDNLVRFSSLVDSDNIIREFLTATFTPIRNDEQSISSGHLHVYVPTNAADKEIAIDTTCYKFKTGRAITINQKAISTQDEDNIVTNISLLQFIDPLSENEQASPNILLHDICYSLRRPDYNENLLPRFVDNFVDLGDKITAIAAKNTENETYFLAMADPLSAEGIPYSVVQQIKAADNSDDSIINFDRAYQFNNKIKLPAFKLHKTALSAMTETFSEGSIAARFFKNRLLVKGTVYASDASTVWLDGVEGKDISSILSEGDQVTLAGYNFPGSSQNASAMASIYDIATDMGSDFTKFVNDSDVLDAVVSSNANNMLGLAIVKTSNSIKFRKYKTVIGGQPGIETEISDLPTQNILEFLGLAPEGAPTGDTEQFSSVEANESRFFVDSEGKLCLSINAKITGAEGGTFIKNFVLTTDKSITDSLKDDSWKEWREYISENPMDGIEYIADKSAASPEEGDLHAINYDIKTLDGTIGQLVGDDETSEFYQSKKQLLGWQGSEKYYDVAGIVSIFDTVGLTGTGKTSVDRKKEPRLNLATLESRYIQHSNYGKLIPGKDKDYYYDSGYLYVHTLLKTLNIVLGEPTNTFEFKGQTYTDRFEAEAAVRDEYGEFMADIHEDLLVADDDAKPGVEDRLRALEVEKQEEIFDALTALKEAFNGSIQIDTHSEGNYSSSKKYWKEINLGMFHYKNRLSDDTYRDKLQEVVEAYITSPDAVKATREECADSQEVMRWYLNKCHGDGTPGSTFPMYVPKVVGFDSQNNPITKFVQAMIYVPGMSTPNESSIGTVADGIAQVAAQNWIDPSEITTIKDVGVFMKHNFEIFEGEHDVSIIDTDKWTCSSKVDISTIELNADAFIQTSSIFEELKYQPKTVAEDFDNLKQYVLIPKTTLGALETVPTDKEMFEGPHGDNYYVGCTHFDTFAEYWKTTPLASYSLDDYALVNVESTIETDERVMPENHIKIIRKGTSLVAFGYIVAPKFNDFYDAASCKAWLISNMDRIKQTAPFTEFGKTFIDNIVSATDSEIQTFYESSVEGIKIGIIASSVDGYQFSLLNTKTSFDDVYAASLVDVANGVKALNYASVCGGKHYVTNVSSLTPSSINVYSEPMRRYDSESIQIVSGKYANFENFKNGVLIDPADEEVKGGLSTANLTKALYAMSNYDDNTVSIVFNDYVTSINQVSNKDPYSEDFNGDGLRILTNSPETDVPLAVAASTDDRIYLNTTAIQTAAGGVQAYEVILSILTKRDVPNQADFIDFRREYNKYFNEQTLKQKIPLYTEVDTKLKANRVYISKMSKTCTAAELAQDTGFPAVIEDVDKIYYNYDEQGNVKPAHNQYGNELMLVNAANHLVSIEEKDGGYEAKESTYEVLASDDITPTPAPDAKDVSIASMIETYNPASDIEIGDAEAVYLREGLFLIKVPEVIDINALKFKSNTPLATDDAVFTEVFEFDDDVVDMAYRDQGVEEANTLLWLSEQGLVSAGRAFTGVDEAVEAAPDPDAIRAALESVDYKNFLTELKEGFKSNFLATHDVYARRNNTQDYKMLSAISSKATLNYRQKLSRAVVRNFSDANNVYAYTYGKVDELGNEQNLVCVNNVAIDSDVFEEITTNAFEMLLPGLVIAAEDPEVEYTTKTKPELKPYTGSLDGRINKPYREIILPFGGYGFSVEQSNKSLNYAQNFKEKFWDNNVDDTYYVPWPEEKDHVAIGGNTYIEPLFKDENMVNSKGQAIVLIDPVNHDPICVAKTWVYPNLKAYCSSTPKYVKSEPIEEDLVNFKDAMHTYTGEDGQKHISILLDKSILKSTNASEASLDADKLQNAETGIYTLFSYDGNMPNLTAVLLASREVDLKPETNDSAKIIDLSVYNDQIVNSIGYSRIYSSYIWEQGKVNMNNAALTYTARTLYQDNRTEYFPTGTPRSGNIWALLNPASSEKVYVADKDGNMLFAYKARVVNPDNSVSWVNTCTDYANASKEVKEVINNIYYNVSHKIQILAMVADTSYVTEYFKNYVNDFGANFVYDIVNKQFSSHNTYAPYIKLGNRAVGSSIPTTVLAVKNYSIMSDTTYGNIHVQPLVGYKVDITEYDDGLTEEGITFTNTINSSIDKDYEICIRDVVSNLTIKDASEEDRIIKQSANTVYFEYYYDDAFCKKQGENQIKAIVVRDKSNKLREVYILKNKISLDLDKSPLIINRILARYYSEDNEIKD